MYLVTCYARPHACMGQTRPWWLICVTVTVMVTVTVTVTRYLFLQRILKENDCVTGWCFSPGQGWWYSNKYSVTVTVTVTDNEWESSHQ
jgi:hypothetical protein